MFERDLFGEAVEPEKHGSVLADTWDYPPFSVLNAREGWWQERKRQWLALGIQSELGRGAGGGDMAFENAGDLESWQRAKRALSPGRSPRPAMDYSKRQRGDGRGRPIDGFAGIKSAGTSPGSRGSGASGVYALRGARQGEEATGTSIFDPVLCELAYRWFCPPGGVVIDPFAGGSVRGIVASHFGLQYHGCELRAAQVEANRAQAHCAATPAPRWYCGDSIDVGTHCRGLAADFVFSCPPYANLEVYSDDPRDISNMEYPGFLEKYRAIIKETCALLRDDRFACFVVAEIRNRQGNYYNFVGDTVSAFLDAGLYYYNEAILVTSVGSLPIRAGRQFKAGRKLGKTHQNILVFAKGSGKKAANICGGAADG